MAEAGPSLAPTTDDPVVIPDDNDNNGDVPTGPLNHCQVKDYVDCINQIMDGMQELLDKDRKDALWVMVKSLK